MPNISVYNKEGKLTDNITIADDVFGVKVNTTLVHDVVVAAFANTRQVLAHTKTRGEVSGSGKKPWKQKGTGRARHGSIRSPLWRGGGITFGPRNDRNYSLQVNKKARATAMRMILSDRTKHGTLIVIDDLTFSEPKTKLFAAMKRALPCGYRRAVVISGKKDDQLLRVTRNIPSVKTTFVGELGVRDLVEYPCVIVSKEAIAQLEKKYQG